jgi:translation initiation factor IF-3
MKVFFKSKKVKDSFESIEFFEFKRACPSSTLFRVVNVESIKEPINGSALVEAAERVGLDILIINDSNSVKIVKIIDMQKYLYEQKKAKKENDKKQKALQAKNKEIRISLNISEHDLDMKVNHAKEFADNGSKVKFLLRLRGREGTGEEGKKYVHNFFNNVLTKFEGYHLEPTKVIGNTIWTEVTKMV